MYYIKILFWIVLFAGIPSVADIDMQKGIYDSAEEMIRMDEKMNRAIAEHNSMDFTEEESMRLESIKIEDFEELEGKYVLTKEIPEMSSTKVEVKIKDDLLIVLLTTIEKNMTEFTQETTISSSTSSLFIPNDADKNRMEKSYKNGILKISLPKK